MITAGDATAWRVGRHVRKDQRMRDVVFIAEDEDPGEDGWYLTGRFSGYLDTGRMADSFEDLELEEAIAWGRARAERVLVRIGYGRHVPAADVAGVAVARRRTPDEAWKDRTEADPPIPWDADVLLSPPDPFADSSDVVAGLAGRLGVPWDASELEGWREDALAARGAGGWVTEHSPSYRLRRRVEAATAAGAEAAARVEPPEGWRVSVFVTPAELRQ